MTCKPLCQRTDVDLEQSLVSLTTGWLGFVCNRCRWSSDLHVRWQCETSPSSSAMSLNPVWEMGERSLPTFLSKFQSNRSSASELATLAFFAVVQFWLLVVIVYILSIFFFSVNINKLYGVSICVENKSLYLEVGVGSDFMYLFIFCFLLWFRC